MHRSPSPTSSLRCSAPRIALTSWCQQTSLATYGRPSAALDALRKDRKAMPMRAHTDNEPRGPVAADPGAQRALQAAHLLQEALTLLCSDSTMPPPQTIRRVPDRLLRLPEVERLTGLRRSAIYEQMRRGIFPRSVKTGQRTAAWPESAVQSWIAERMNGRAT